MRKGKRQQILSVLLRSITIAYNTNLLNFKSNTSTLNWQTIHTIFSSSFYDKKYKQYPDNILFYNMYNYSYSALGKEHNNFMDMRNFALTSINEINPIFSFYVYKVDKAIYKNSRGKSGKYTFI